MEQSTMKACVLKGGSSPHMSQIPRPCRKPGEVLVKVTLAGICNTDLEIARGYVPDFSGIPGHEFVGVIQEAEDMQLIGRRATAEINCGCGRCAWCRADLGRHCPSRTVMGIINRDGCFAEYVSVPRENLLLIPDALSDIEAVFIEPMAAALEILDQVPLHEGMEVLLWGDGKLGQLVAHALASTGCKLTVVGKHPSKLALLDGLGIRTVEAEQFRDGRYDLVVEATGRAPTLERAAANTKPRGTLVLKSTYAAGFPLNLSSIVVDEITVIGSRCGRFAPAASFIESNRPALEALVETVFSLEQIETAFEEAEKAGAMKILLKP